MFTSLMPTATRPDSNAEAPSRAPYPVDLRSRHAAIGWALLYTYLILAAPAPDPTVVATTAQEIMGWVLSAAIIAVFVTALGGRKLAPIALGASAIGGGVLSYNGIECIMAGHTNPMFYVMAVGGAALVLHALSTVRRTPAA